MSNNRYNKPPVKRSPDYTPKAEKKKPEEIKLVFENCCVCNKQITDGYWGRYKDGGVCSKSCDIIYNHNLPSFIDYVLVKE